jgi:hypothetical protein
MDRDFKGEPLTNRQGSGDVESRPEVVTLEYLLNLISHGEIRIPTFQRPLVWRADQMLALFDSIEHGYPIGTLLLWDTEQYLETADDIGGIPLPSPRPGRQVSYVLDGQQRLSTLFGGLFGSLEYQYQPDSPDWVWHIYRVLHEEPTPENNYVHWRSASPPPSNFLPMRATLRTLDFLDFARQLARGGRGTDREDRLLAQAEFVAQRIKSYRLPIVRMRGGDLQNTAEAFVRINTAGRTLTQLDLFSATSRISGNKSLGYRIEEIVGQTHDSPFGEIDTTIVLRTLLAISGENDISLSRLYAHDRAISDKAIKHTDIALGRAIAFLIEELGVPISQLIPHSLQIVFLAMLLHHDPSPSKRKLDTIRRWFWITSWSGQLATANTTLLRNSIADFRNFAIGSVGYLRHIEAGDESDLIHRSLQALPERFNTRSARLRAFLVWDLTERPFRLGLNGESFNAAKTLQKFGLRAYQKICTTRNLPNSSSFANRILLEVPLGGSARDELWNSPTNRRWEILKSAGSSSKAIQRLQDGDETAFIITRAEDLAQGERFFIRRIQSPGMGGHS